MAPWAQTRCLQLPEGHPLPWRFAGRRALCLLIDLLGRALLGLLTPLARLSSLIYCLLRRGTLVCTGVTFCRRKPSRLGTHLSVGVDQVLLTRDLHGLV